MSDRLVTIATFRDVPEALLAKGKLESAGIECLLGDEYIVRMDWFWANAVGGIKLRVPEEEASAAQEILNSVEPEIFQQFGLQEHEDQRICPRCGSSNISYGPPNRGLQLLALYFAALPLPKGADRWKCASCGAHWQVVPDRDVEETP
jgi:ribosomal protein S27AE